MNPFPGATIAIECLKMYCISIKINKIIIKRICQQPLFKENHLSVGYMFTRNVLFNSHCSLPLRHKTLMFVT